MKILDRIFNRKDEQTNKTEKKNIYKDYKDFVDNLNPGDFVSFIKDIPVPDISNNIRYVVQQKSIVDGGGRIEIIDDKGSRKLIWCEWFQPIIYKLFERLIFKLPDKVQLADVISKTIEVKKQFYQKNIANLEKQYIDLKKELAGMKSFLNSMNGNTNGSTLLTKETNIQYNYLKKLIKEKIYVDFEMHGSNEDFSIVGKTNYIYAPYKEGEESKLIGRFEVLIHKDKFDIKNIMNGTIGRQNCVGNIRDLIMKSIQDCNWGRAFELLYNYLISPLEYNER